MPGTGGGDKKIQQARTVATALAIFDDRDFVQFEFGVQPPKNQKSGQGGIFLIHGYIKLRKTVDQLGLEMFVGPGI